MAIMPTHAITSTPYLQKSSSKSIRINGAVNGISSDHVNGAVTPPLTTNPMGPAPSGPPAPLLAKFLNAYKELASYK
jgi:hypothetical protein